MGISIPEELSVFGVTSKDFADKKSYLSKSVKDEVDENDVIWELYKDLAKKALNFEILQMIYWNMAVFKDKLGQDSFEYQQKSHQSRLLNLKQQGKTKVRINASGCSASCRKMHNLVLPLSKALKNLPVPNPKCESTLNSSKTWCTSIYIVAKNSSVDSINLPPAVSNLPKLPNLEDNFEGNRKDSSLFSDGKFFGKTIENLEEWILPLLTFILGISLFYFSPILSAILVVWSIPFFPPVMMRIRGIFPFFKKKWERLLILGVGLLITILVFFLSLLPEFKINAFRQKSVLPSYQILLIKDQSNTTRSRLNVSIFAPHASNSKERAQVAMKAAREIHDTQIFDDTNNKKYDYVFVALVASEFFLRQDYVLAEAEYAPDGRGFKGALGFGDDKWKWNVRSSNLPINPNDSSSLQKVKGTLETFLKK